jgi:hypothetical protein
VTTPKAWTFTQLGGAKKSLVLSDADAPHGRPRQKAVVRTALKIRQRTVRYPGNDGPPTRHIFGDEWPPWELTGRFSDSYGGNGYAKARVAEVLAFVQAKQEVSIRWGDVVSVTGFLEEFDPGLESDGEAEWKLRVLVDTNDTVQTTKAAEPLDSTATMAKVVAALSATVANLQNDANVSGSFLDAIDSVVSTVSGAIGAVSNAANSIQNLETATFAQISRLRAGIGQLRTASITLQNTLSSASEEALMLRQAPLASMDVLGLRAKSDVALTESAASMADADRKAQIAARGTAASVIVAKGGDTWESLAARALGDPGAADLLRSANGGHVGSMPVPGRSYVVPSA